MMRVCMRTIEPATIFEYLKTSPGLRCVSVGQFPQRRKVWIKQSLVCWQLLVLSRLWPRRTRALRLLKSIGL
jgi:hypothetical protein